MKKKIIGGVAALVVAAAVAFNVNAKMDKGMISGVEMENIEAMAACEVERSGQTIRCAGETGSCTIFLYNPTMTMSCSGRGDMSPY